MKIEKIYRSLQLLTFPRAANRERMPDTLVVSVTFLAAVIALMINLIAIS